MKTKDLSTSSVPVKELLDLSSVSKPAMAKRPIGKEQIVDYEVHGLGEQLNKNPVPATVEKRQ